MESKAFQNSNKINKKDFTRKRKIGFRDIILFEIGTLKKTLVSEIEDFVNKFEYKKGIFTKQSFSEARQKVNPKAFKELNEDVIVEGTYEGEHKTYKGYTVLSIDGSTIQLPNVEALKEEYGKYKNKGSNVEVAIARIGIIYDVLNEITLAGKLTKYSIGERQTAEELIAVATKVEKPLILMDRGYPSVRLIKLLETFKIKYLMRIPIRFIQETNKFIERKSIDESIELNINKTRKRCGRIKGITGEFKLNIRCVRLNKEEGMTEYLISNLTEEEVRYEEIAELYSKRWGIETNYNIIKNVLELGNFTGETKTAVEQDFYATIYLNNVANIGINEAQEKYDKQQKGKNKKYEYKINRSVAVSHLKKRLITIYITDSKRKRNKMLEDIIEQIQKSVLPKRENRKFPRNGHISKFGGRTHKRVL
jgi:hypothetical protein